MPEEEEEEEEGQGSSRSCLGAGGAGGGVRTGQRGGGKTTKCFHLSIAWVQGGTPESGPPRPSPSDVSLLDNYLLKNGTSDVLLCGNSSDAGYVALDPRGSEASPCLPSCRVPSSFPTPSCDRGDSCEGGADQQGERTGAREWGALGCSPGGPAGPPTSSTLAPSLSRSPPGLPPRTQPSPSLQTHPLVGFGVSMASPAAWTLLQGIRAPGLPWVWDPECPLATCTPDWGHVTVL